MRREFRKKAVSNFDVEKHLQDALKDLQNVLPYLENALNDIVNLIERGLLEELVDTLEGTIQKTKFVINGLTAGNLENLSEFAEEMRNESQLLYSIERGIRDLGNKLSNLSIARDFESGITSLITLDYVLENILPNTGERIERRKVIEKPFLQTENDFKKLFK